MENPKVFKKKIYLDSGIKINIIFVVKFRKRIRNTVKKNDSIFCRRDMLKLIKYRKDINFYIRMHPNLQKVGWSYVSEILNLRGLYQNSFLIDLILLFQLMH